MRLKYLKDKNKNYKNCNEKPLKCKDLKVYFSIIN